MRSEHRFNKQHVVVGVLLVGGVGFMLCGYQKGSVERSQS